jgi:hypothetical protein
MQPAQAPDCGVGLEYKRSGSFEGCCLASDAITSQITLDANCDSGTGKAAVFVRRYGNTQSECPAYDFTWGTVAP